MTVVASKLCAMAAFVMLLQNGMASPLILAADEAPEKQPAAKGAGTDLDDPAEPFTSARPRSSLESDRVQAMALFAAARTFEQQEEFAAALKLYERALRFDPDSLPILRQVVSLALTHLDRPDVALRYALKLVERDPTNAPLLRNLAVRLTGLGDLKGALRLFQKSMEIDPGDKKSARYILVREEMGRLLYRTDDFQAAADAFAEVVEALDHPDEYQLSAEVVKAILDPPSQTYQLFGEAFVRAGRGELAESAFRKAFHEAGQQNVLAFHAARAKLSAGQAAEALDELQKYFAAHEKSEKAEPYKLLGDILSKLDRQAEYVGKLEALFKDDHDNAPLGVHLADQYQAAGRLDDAVKLYEEVLKDSPTADGYAGLAAVYQAQGKDEPLLRTLGRFVSQSGDLASLGAEAEKLAEDKELRARLLELAAKLKQEQPDMFDYGLRLTAALLAMSAEDFSLAGEYYALAIEARPDNAAELYLTWGVSLLVADKPPEAVAVFQKAIETKALADNDVIFHYYLSGALELSGRTDEAVAAIDHALKSNPDSPRLYSRLAWINYHAKRYDDALRAYEDLIDKFSQPSGSAELRRLLREARLVLSNICVVQKNLPAAEKWLEEVLDEYPEDITAINDLAYLWADQGKHLERALQMAETAVAAEPDNAAYQDTLGWALYRVGRFAEAVEHLQQAAAGDKPDAVVLEHLGDAHWGLQQAEPAIAAWNRALEKYDPAETAERAEKTREKIKQAEGK